MNTETLTGILRFCSEILGSIKKDMLKIITLNYFVLSTLRLPVNLTVTTIPCTKNIVNHPYTKISCNILFDGDRCGTPRWPYFSFTYSH